jgi:hypothetical protein
MRTEEEIRDKIERINTLEPPMSTLMAILALNWVLDENDLMTVADVLSEKVGEAAARLIALITPP